MSNVEWQVSGNGYDRYGAAAAEIKPRRSRRVQSAVVGQSRHSQAYPLESILMSSSLFQVLVFLAGFAAVAAVVTEVLSTKNLSETLRDFKQTQSAVVIAFCDANPLFTRLRRGIFFGYFISLGCTGAFVPGSREVYLAFSVAWSVLSYMDGPHILPKPMIPFYEAALLLNGAVLALCFLSPLSSQFQW